MVIVGGTRILTSKNPTLLKGDGKIELTKDCKYLLQQVGFVKRKATTKAKLNPKDFEEIKELFLLDVCNVVKMDEICDEMIVNWDQTGINCPSISWTMAPEGSKRVELIRKDDMRQITVTFAGSMNGNLPLQVVYQGKTPRCLPKFDFLSNWHVTFTPNYWCNEEMTEEYIKMVIIPYFEQTKLKLKLAADALGLVLLDNFNGQCTDKIFQLLEKNNINAVIIPANCTDRLQLLDVL